MRGDERYTLFFANLSLFTAGMLIVVLADNLLLMLFGWEIMGICSYFLIGHYWEDVANARAAIKAFLTTRVGDLGFMAGIFVFAWAARSFEIDRIIDGRRQRRDLQHHRHPRARPCCSAGPSASRASSRSTPGCPTPWPARPRCRP
jgi:NADH-quinone oxidoreductase subunit L